MVHALREIWRVLVPRGTLLDLRPIAGEWPVEVVGRGPARLAGRLEQPPDDPDDLAANRALARAVREGLFTREREASFVLARYWPTPEEMRAYIAEEWTNARVPRGVVAQAKRLMADAGEGARVRVWSSMILARLRKKRA